MNDQELQDKLANEYAANSPSSRQAKEHFKDGWDAARANPTASEATEEVLKTHETTLLKLRIAELETELQKEKQYSAETHLRFEQQNEEITALRTENAKYRQEMDKMQQGIPSEWAYSILLKERDQLHSELVWLVKHSIKAGAISKAKGAELLDIPLIDLIAELDEEEK